MMTEFFIFRKTIPLTWRENRNKIILGFIHAWKDACPDNLTFLIVHILVILNLIHPMLDWFWISGGLVVCVSLSVCRLCLHHTQIDYRLPPPLFISRLDWFCVGDLVFVLLMDPVLYVWHWPLDPSPDYIYEQRLIWMQLCFQSTAPRRPSETQTAAALIDSDLLQRVCKRAYTQNQLKIIYMYRFFLH